MFFHRNIGPVVPGGHAYLARQLIDTIDGAPFVAACNDELVADGFDDIFLRLAFQVLQFALFDLGVDGGVDTYSAYDNTGLR